RRRHTRFSRDWSSDVCSSDLIHPLLSLSPAPGIASLAKDFTHGHPLADLHLWFGTKVPVRRVDPERQTRVVRTVLDYNFNSTLGSVRVGDFGHHRSRCGSNDRLTPWCRHVDSAVIGFATTLARVGNGPVL